VNRGPLAAADLDPSGVADRGPDGPETGRGPGRAGDHGTRPARDREGERAPGDAGGPTGDREGERVRREAGGPAGDRGGEWPRRDVEEQVGGDGGGRAGAGDGGAWVPLGDMWVADVVGPAAAEVAAGPEGATREGACPGYREAAIGRDDGGATPRSTPRPGAGRWRS
jgi:hypothetical protein